jgi:hypothetical protein
VKAKSDGSLASTSVSPAADSPLSKSHRSRSLEPLSGLATWSSEPQVIELVKGERGLGFSILDYQVLFFFFFFLAQQLSSHHPSPAFPFFSFYLSLHFV